MNRTRIELVGVGMVFGGAGLLVAQIARESPTLQTSCVASISAALTGMIVWRITSERLHRQPWWRAALIGGGIGLLSHPVFHYLMGSSYWTLQQLGLAKIGPAGPAVDPLNALWGCLLYSIVSWILFGVQSFLAGSMAGLIAVVWRRRLDLPKTI